ncbi:MAG: hypothetical protein LH477_04105 [Nocardioides sp.]|nr:hypothetical protein [Nocardioides sp.]
MWTPETMPAESASEDVNRVVALPGDRLLAVGRTDGGRVWSGEPSD